MTVHPSRQSVRRSLQIGLIWLGLGVVNATQVVAGMRAVGMQHRWAELFLTFALSWLVWAAATPVVLSLTRRFPPSRATEWRGWLTHATACLAIVLADAAWIGFLNWSLDPYAAGPQSYRFQVVSALSSRFDVDLITYAGIMEVGYLLDSVRQLADREAESARLSAELAKTRLDALRRQLEPHFLFNTLNGISGLVRDRQNEAAVDMIAGLSDLLRHVLERGERQLVPLAEELSFVEKYAELQVMRFGDRLKVFVDVPLELYGALVPTLILQPLVENAIVHGIGRTVEGGSVRVSASRVDDALILAVRNDGPPLPSGEDRRHGVGISNTRGRLHTLYGPECAIEIRNGVPAGVETLVRVPYRFEA